MTRPESPTSVGCHARLVQPCTAGRASSGTPATRHSHARPAFTLIELLVTIALTAGLMLVVTQLFVAVNNSIRNSRATLEMTDRLRATVSRLRLDLQGATADMVPPGRPEGGKGYFEYVEGPVGPVTLPEVAARNTEQTDAAGNPLPDTSAADADDILMLTVRSRGEPFTGRTFVKTTGGPYGDKIRGAFAVQTRTAQSQLAEVVWFVRGTTLYRRVLLILPEHDTDLRTPGVVEPLPASDVPGIAGGLYYTAASARDAGFYGDYFERQFGEKDHRSKAFYNNFDLSVRFESGADPDNPALGRWVPNTLADLTRRECRFAHQPSLMPPGTLGSLVPFSRFDPLFPFNPHAAIRIVGGNVSSLASDWQYLGLPTLRECSHADWVAGRPLPFITLDKANAVFDAWANPHPFGPGTNSPPTVDHQDPETGTLILKGSNKPPAGPDLRRYLGPRVAEDVILSNVIGFDVKAWDLTAPIVSDTMDPALTKTALVPGDPGYNAARLAGNPVVGRGAYVDLGYAPLAAGVTPLSQFSHNGHVKSLLPPLSRVYDTWSIHYEHDGLDQNLSGVADEATDGFDSVEDTGGIDTDGDGVVKATDGVVDDLGERETMPPYPVPLKGLQIKIRVFEPDTRQIREITIVHDFLPQ